MTIMPIFHKSIAHCQTARRLRRLGMVVLLAMIGLGLYSARATAATPTQTQEDDESEILTADLSAHIIKVNSGFHGAEMLLFGATEEPGDVVVVVRGPNMETEVHRKDKIYGLWINNKSVVFKNAPSYYAVAATRPLAEIAGRGLLHSEQIGVETISPLPADEKISDAERSEFTKALIDENIRKSRYQSDVTPVNFVGKSLFRSVLQFPANLPSGEFNVAVYLIKNGEIIASQSTALLVTPVGLTGLVVAVADNHPLVYGFLAVILALIVGTIIPLLINRAKAH